MSMYNAVEALSSATASMKLIGYANLVILNAVHGMLNNSYPILGQWFTVKTA